MPPFSNYYFLFLNIHLVTSGKKNMPTIFRLGARAISTCLAVNWQLGQLIDFLFSCTALYSAISSRLAVNWQVGQLISN
jgi:hypothetical protein